MSKDPDFNCIKMTLEHNQELSKGPSENKAYYKEWIEGRSEVQDGIVYQLEVPKATSKNLKTEETSSNPTTMTHDPSSIPHNTPDRTHQILQDVLAHSGKILVARHEQGYQRCSHQLRSLIVE
jgi:hypothetical protein